MEMIDMESKQISVRVDKEIKEKAEKALENMGLTISSAVNMFLTRVANEKRIPFEITAQYEQIEK